MNPISAYLKNLFSRKRILTNNAQLNKLVRADALLSALVNEKQVPGLAISVFKQGRVLLQKGYGYADLATKTPIDPERTIFRIASVSKNIAATALAHMVSDGLIDLNRSFYEYVPYFPKKKWDFTIRQLAGHTAGIRGYKGTEYGLNKPYTIKDSIAIFADDDLVFQPGTDYLYNSYDWVLLSLAMQEASGIPFDAYVRQTVLRPLGMNNTYSPSETGDGGVADIPAQKMPLAHFYSKNRLGFRTAMPVNNAYKLAGGGYLSTAVDIAKFGQAYLNGEVLSEAMRATFLTSQTIKDNKTYYGLGWQVSEDKYGRPFYGHVGNGVGGYSNFFVYPEEQMVFAILINCTNPNVQEQLDAIVQALIAESEGELT